jgi:hypothetical protein
MQFSLRTIFIIFTTVAVYTAVNVALVQWAGAAKSLGPYAASMLPMFLLWVVAVFWIYEHRATLTGYRLVLIALLLSITWRLASQAITSLAFRLISTSGAGVPWLFTLQMFLDGFVRAAAWALVIYAFVRANDTKQVDTNSPWLPDEPAAPER